jgi:hypothetical protein
MTAGRGAGTVVLLCANQNQFLGGVMRNRWDRWVPLTGVALVVLFVGEGVLSGTEPPAGASAAKVVAFYSLHRVRLEIGDYLLGLAVVVGLFFYGYLREHIRVAEGSPRLAATAFAGAVLFAVSGALGAGASLALADVPGKLSPAAAQALNLLQNDLVTFAVNAGAAVLLLASGLAIVRGRGLRVWTGWLALVLAVVTFIPIPNIGAPPAAIWTLVVSVVLFARGPELARAGRPEAGRPAPSVAG